MATKVNFTLDDRATELMENVSPELRNAAVILAIKMFSKSSVYKNYFCTNCEEIEDDEDINDPLANSSKSTNDTSQVATTPTVSWDQF